MAALLVLRRLLALLYFCVAVALLVWNHGYDRQFTVYALVVHAAFYSLSLTPRASTGALLFDGFLARLLHCLSLGLALAMGTFFIAALALDSNAAAVWASSSGISETDAQVSMALLSWFPLLTALVDMALNARFYARVVYAFRSPAGRWAVVSYALACTPVLLLLLSLEHSFEGAYGPQATRLAMGLVALVASATAAGVVAALSGVSPSARGYTLISPTGEVEGVVDPSVPGPAAAVGGTALAHLSAGALSDAADELAALLADREFAFMVLLSRVLPSSANKTVTTPLLRVLGSRGRRLRCLQALIRDDAATTQSSTTLLRGNTLATAGLREFCHSEGAAWLGTVVVPALRALMTAEGTLELDPLRDPAATGAEREARLAVVRRALALLTESVTTTPLPPAIRTLCVLARLAVGERFGLDDVAVSHNVLAGIIFLRFVVPAFATPDSEMFTLAGLPTDPRPEQRRALIRFAQTVQNLANRSRFTQKEPSMMVLNAELDAATPALVAWFDAMGAPARDAAAGIEEHVDPPRSPRTAAADLGVVLNVLAEPDCNRTVSAAADAAPEGPMILRARGLLRSLRR